MKYLFASFQLAALFCLAMAVSTSFAAPTTDDDFSLDFEERGPDGLKKCTRLLEKQQKAFTKCKQTGST